MGSQEPDWDDEMAASHIARGRNLFDVVGWRGLLAVVWRATPFPCRLVSWPYGLAVYRRLLIASDCLACLFVLHGQKYCDSLLFRVCRPRYREARRLLRAAGCDGLPATSALGRESPATTSVDRTWPGCKSRTSTTDHLVPETPPTVTRSGRQGPDGRNRILALPGEMGDGLCGRVQAPCAGGPVRRRLSLPPPRSFDSDAM
jgi:hypothetical protein